MKKSTSRQSTWSFKSSIVLRYSSPCASSTTRQSASNGRALLYCYKKHQRTRLSRRCTYPLTYSTASTSMRLYATRHLAAAASLKKQIPSPPTPPLVFSTLFNRAATISSATASTTAHHSIPTTMSFVGLASSHDDPQYPPIFHTQSLLFLFGFLFFPCWWIGALCCYQQRPIKDNNQDGCRQYQEQQQQQQCYQQQWQKQHQTMIPVHPSLLANGRVASRVLWLPPPLIPQEDEEKGAVNHAPNRNSSNGISDTTTTAAGDPTTDIVHDWYEREKDMYRRWNKYMSFASIGLMALAIAMFIWYDIGVRRSWWRALT